MSKYLKVKKLAEDLDNREPYDALGANYVVWNHQGNF